MEAGSGDSGKQKQGEMTPSCEDLSALRVATTQPEPGERVTADVVIVLQCFLNTDSWEEAAHMLENEPTLLLTDTAEFVLLTKIAQTLLSELPERFEQAYYLALHLQLIWEHGS